MAPGLGGEEEDGRGGSQEAAEERDGQPRVHLAAEVHHERSQNGPELEEETDSLVKVHLVEVKKDLMLEYSSLVSIQDQPCCSCPRRQT